MKKNFHKKKFVIFLFNLVFIISKYKLLLYNCYDEAV